MVGLIPNLLVKLIRSLASEGTLFEIFRRAELPADHQYDLNKVYPDAQWRRLLATTLQVLDISQQQAEEAYADFFCRDALARFPVWFEMSQNSYEFLSRQPAIHNTFATGLHDVVDRAAVLDKFRVVTGDRSLTTYYRSANRLCGLYIALARWIVDHYGDEVTIGEAQCIKQGAEECQIQVAWTRLRG